MKFNEWHIQNKNANLLNLYQCLIIYFLRKIDIMFLISGPNVMQNVLEYGILFIPKRTSVQRKAGLQNSVANNWAASANVRFHWLSFFRKYNLRHILWYLSYKNIIDCSQYWMAIVTEKLINNKRNKHHSCCFELTAYIGLLYIPSIMPPLPWIGMSSFRSSTFCLFFPREIYWYISKHPCLCKFTIQIWPFAYYNTLC